MKKLIIFLILGGMLYGGARLHLNWTRPNSDSTTRVSFAIPSGSSLKRVSHILEDKELIRDAWSFELYARRHDLATRFQAGEYVMLRNLTFAEVAEVIQTGKSSEIKVTLPEGSTIKQIDEILAKRNLIELGDFVHCTNTCDLGFRVSNLEGYLLTSTYFVNPQSFSSKKFIQRLYQNFQIQIQPFESDVASSGRTLDEIVIVASMIEREAFGDSREEKKMIADVIWKRLDERIHLGIDATTRYELDEWKRPLYTEDFQLDTPYNTRKRYGLPPTAISNPSMASFEAAVQPVSTEYYYYLHDRSGNIRFGRNLEEHNANKRQYLN